MIDFNGHKDQILNLGFTVIDKIYSNNEVEQIVNKINQTDTSRQAFRKSSDLFAIRQFLKAVPETCNLIFNDNLNLVIQQILGESYFVVKSIYFDKSETSNWFVSYHQDLTISVEKKVNVKGFGPWTVKQNQFAVQPPLDILKNIFTIRIHLDDTDENNGALKVIPKSHLRDIYRPETIDWALETETICKVQEGGLMIMRPLILHGSNKTTNNKKRRVIHIELSSMELPKELEWSERMNNFGQAQMRQSVYASTE